MADHWTETEAPFYVVAPYLVRLAYGGPEEGGWWFDSGVPVEDDPDLFR